MIVMMTKNKIVHLNGGKNVHIGQIELIHQ